jgi:hypothetical protein
MSAAEALEEMRREINALIVERMTLRAALQAIVADAKPLPVPMGKNLLNPFPLKYAPLIEQARAALQESGK